MPFYRVNGLWVHMNLGGKLRRNPPAQCVVPIPNPDAAKAAETPHVRCCGMSAFLCDHKLSDGTTCDAPLCQEHATEVAVDRHLCPKHLAEKRATEPELF